MKPEFKGGALIKRLRQKHGWSQEAFAQRLGVSFATVSRWENGHQKPSRLAIRTLEALESKPPGPPPEK